MFLVEYKRCNEHLIDAHFGFLLMLLLVHILVSERDAPAARSILLATSFLVHLQLVVPPRYTNLLTCFNGVLSITVFAGPSSQAILCTLSPRCLFSVQILYTPCECCSPVSVVHLSIPPVLLCHRQT